MVKMTQRCERCNGYMLREPDGPTCVNCGHVYMPPEELALAEELSRNDMHKGLRGPQFKTIHESSERLVESDRAYRKRKRERMVRR